MYDIEKLNNKKVSELREIAEKLNISKSDKLKKQELVYKILDEQALKPNTEVEKKAPVDTKPVNTNPNVNSNVISNDKKIEKVVEANKNPNQNKENNNNKTPDRNNVIKTIETLIIIKTIETSIIKMIEIIIIKMIEFLREKTEI